MRLEDFLTQLQVVVTLEPLVERHLPQVAYLTERTVEFHLTGRARAVDELAALLATGTTDGWLVAVRDRFGDYGVAGAIVVTRVASEAVIDSFVLNCRVLGKQVEDLTLRQVARIIEERGCNRIRLRYCRTPRNAPAAAFVQRLGGDQLEITEDGCEATIPLAALSAVAMVPSETQRVTPAIDAAPVTTARFGSSADAAALVATRWARLDPPRRTALVSDIATTLRSGDQVLTQIRQRRRRSRDLTQRYVAPRTELERSIAAIWQEVLGVDQVGSDDDFFTLGGHSLLAAQVVARLRSAYQVELPLRRLFEHPTIAQLARCIEQANADKQLPQIPLVPVERSAPLPLSFAQRRLWFLDQLQPGNAAYNVPTVVRLSGPLDLDALEQALNMVITRHETLRTTIGMRDAEPVQVIVPALTLRLTVVDLESHLTAERERAALEQAVAEAQRPFDLARGPLVRASVLRVEPYEHVLVLVLHHIISDGWSMGVLVQEVAALYQARLASIAPSLPDLLIQYADFAIWQRQWLRDEMLEQLLTYWKQQLRPDGRDLPILHLPTDYPRPALPSGRGARYSFELSQPLTAALLALSHREGVTLFMTLLTAFATLLSRYTGQTDLPIGTPIANRSRPELERLIGFFANTLVLRLRLDGVRSFRALLARVREVCLGAYAHEDLPFEQVVEAVQQERDLSRHPLFQVMFVLQNTPLAPITLPGLTFNPLRLDSGTTKFDLTLTFVEQPDGLLGALEYNTDIFAADSIARLADHLTTLLRGVVADVDRPLADLPWLTEGEQYQILRAWNATTVRYPEYRSLHELIEAQAARTPDAVAVVFEDARLTYDALNRRANQLAHHLRRRGIGPDMLVGVCMERSVELVVALLGVLKAGGAYVPFDPSYPRDRLQFMLEDAQAGVLLTQSHLLPHLPAYDAAPICLDDAATLLDGEPETNPEIAVDLDNLAYVIYTSGSTGRPKGAMNTHRGICNRLFWMQDAYQLTPHDRVLQKTPFSFDVSVWEFFWPLLTGARLVVARPGGHQDPAYLVRLIAEQQITTLHFVPSMLQVFLAEAGLERLSSLRRVICSGEALPYELQERCFARLAAELHNLYGPTEAAVDVTYWACTPEYERRIVPIGRPIANTQCYVLDRRMRPVPVGVAGELYLGGVQLARGYHSRPELTAEKFVPDPFSGAENTTPGARLYRTGDLARYRADGTIEFLGRIDYQIKLRGLRIELEEIEAVLRQHPLVDDTVIVVRDDGAGQQLVAYVVLGEHHEPGARNQHEDQAHAGSPCSALSASDPLAVASAAELRSFLQNRLPEYMVPAACVFLHALPLSPNGKVDRKALPAPQIAAVVDARARTAPRTGLERRLARIWAEVLKLEEVGIDDNFFELGGDSFRAIQLAQRLEHAVSVLDVLKRQTIRELAELMEAGVAAGASKERTILYHMRGPQRPRATLVCVPYGGGNPIAYQALAHALPPDYGLYAVQLPGHDFSRKDEALEPVDVIARRCVDEIKDLPGPVVLYGHCAGGAAVTIEIARLLQAAGTPAQAVFLAAIMPPQTRTWLGRLLPRLSLLNKALPNSMLHAYLKRLGGFDGALDPAELGFVMNMFRHDGLRSLEYFERVLHVKGMTKIQAPVFCIVGDRDPLTKKYARRATEWKCIAERVHLTVIAGAGHYFVKHQAQELSELIVRLLSSVAERNERT
jgi:amino acid adenylation domain-containing protein